MKRLIQCDVSVCHAECCGIVPLPAETVKEFSHLLRPDSKISDAGLPGTLFATAENNICGFLTADYRCAIYDHRPEICRIFGAPGQKHPCLKCSFKRKKGVKKDSFELREIYKLADKLGFNVKKS